MAPIRISDRWLAVGLLTVAYLSACLISWHKSEGERLDAEAKETAHESEKTRLAAQEQTRVRTEDGTFGLSQHYNLLYICIQRLTREQIFS